MRVFTCLSQNVSMAVGREKKGATLLPRRPRLNFKSKKRRPSICDNDNSSSSPRVVVTPRTKVRQASKSLKFDEENMPPHDGRDQANRCPKPFCHRINKPLPPIPDQGGVSIYIKELNQDENNTDYLPLSHVVSPLMEEEESGTSPLTIGSSSIPATRLTDSVNGERAGKTENVYSDISETDFKLKSVKSLNEAFIQSAANLQARQALQNRNRGEAPCSYLDQHVDITYSRRKQLRNRDWKRHAHHSPDTIHPSNNSPSPSIVNVATSGVSQASRLPCNIQYELRGDTLQTFEFELGHQPTQRASNLDNSLYSQVEFSSQDASQWTTLSKMDDLTGDSQKLYVNVDGQGRPRCEGQSQSQITVDQTICDRIEDDESQFSDYSQVDYTPSTSVSELNTQTECTALGALGDDEEEDDGYSRMECIIDQCPNPPQPSPNSPHYVNVNQSTGPNMASATNQSLPGDSSDCRASEFLGCMSFGVPHLLNKDLDGWYYLLTEEVGRKKHLKSHSKNKPASSSRGQAIVPPINKAVDGQERIVITVPRGKNGFGFSFVGELPPKVGRVDRASPAEQAGVKKGDVVIRINGQNVSRSSCESVAHLVKKNNPQFLALELLRDHVVGTNSCESMPSATKRGVGTSTDHVYESILERSGDPGEHHKENQRWATPRGRENQEEEFLTDDEQIISHGGLGNRGNLAAITSTPMPTKVPSNVPPSSAQWKKQESIHRLMSLELDYIDFMRFGTERYSRPLRHCIISPSQHSIIFQNVEKLVTISEYHIKQLQDSNSSVNSDTDDSQSSESNIFPNSVALTFRSKIHMLCQAYETYAHGLIHSNSMLRELRRSQDFMKFIHEPSSDYGPTISAFINRPVQHIHELYAVLRDIFSVTPLHSPDYAVLQQVVCKLGQCITAITNLSSDGRVHSLDSLTSSQGCSTSQTTSSGKGSMASLTSCSSAETDALCPLVPASSSNRSVDPEVARIQDMLLFPPDVPTFLLCQEDRHIIFQGDIFRYQQGSWFKSQLLLLSDLVLLLDQEVNGRLRVVAAPIFLSDLAGIEINRKHASEFIFHLHATPTYSAIPRTNVMSSSSSTKPLVLRAPSSQEKFMWKSLVEQRVATVSGNRLKHYGSMRDISNIKTSVVL